MTLRRVITAISAFGLATAIGCRPWNPTPAPSPTPTITSVSVSCQPTTVQSEQTSQCTSSVHGSGSYKSDVSWTASSGTISSAGLYTAPTFTASAVVTISATSTEDKAKSGSASVTVNPLPTALSFLTINDVTLDGLGQTISPIDLSLYAQGGTAPLTFAIVSQTSTNSEVCSIAAAILLCDFSYFPGTNTVTVSVADANGLSAKTSFNIIVTPPTVAYRTYGTNFSPYAPGQDPNAGSDISTDQITRYLGAMAPYTRNMRSFGIDHGLDKIGCIAHKFGLGAWIGMWISDIPNDPTNDAGIATLISLAKAGCVDVAVIGSEVLQRSAIPNPDQVLINYITQFRNAVPGIPVTTADTFNKLLTYSNVGNSCDLIFVNYYPYWEGQDVSLAVADLNAEDIQVSNTFAGKEIVVSESGWPSDGAVQGSAVPSLANAAYYFLDFESWAQANNRRTFYFEFVDEAWKTSEGTMGPHWGVWDENLVLKYGSDVFGGATIADNWSCKAPPGGAGTPSISFTSVPPIGGTSLLQGQVYHVAPNAYYVAIYIYVNSGWWTKPTFAQSETTIQCTGAFSADIVTGGSDQNATKIAAYIMPYSYGTPPSASGQGTLPASLSQNAVASVTVSR